MAEFQVGQLIENRYRVQSMVGSGWMANLCCASDEARDGEIVALKMVSLDPLAAGTDGVEERFRREFQILTQLHHPNLVSVYDYGIMSGGELYFTMEWIQGQDLASCLDRFEPLSTIPVIVQICRALTYLHARDVIHGDLKPSHVLTAADAQIKIVGFDVARGVKAPETQVQYYVPGYTAPEVKDWMPVDHRADLYGLGAIWYTLLVGEPPAFIVGVERLIRLSLDEVLQNQDEIPVEIGGIIARLLATSPKDRYASANEVVAAVNRVTGSTYALETRETASSYALRGRFVGRESEMQVLQALWEQAQSEGTGLVLIGGESGVGKTRLMEELEIQAELEGARVVWGQCVEHGGSGYHPWREVLWVLLRYVESADATVIKQVAPVLAGMLPELRERADMADLAPPADLEPQAVQQRLNNAIVEMLQAAAELRPTIIMIDNAHWADEATLALLALLSRMSEQVGWLVCVAYRTDEIDLEHPLVLLAGDGVQRIQVQNLLPKSTADLVRFMLGLEELPPSLIERVQQVTGGNAFFVQELVRSLAEEGVVLQRTVDGWQVDHAALQKARLPESIRQVVWRRWEHLSADARQVLQWAAVVGPIFWNGALEEIDQLSKEQVQAALYEGIEQELIVERDASAFAGEREYMFVNPAVREVSYESISQEERRGIHDRTATWLMTHSDEVSGVYAGLIANHLEKVGQMKRAAEYLQRAGEQAAAQFAHAEATDYLSRALDLIPKNDAETRYQVLLAREKVYDLQGARQAQLQDLETLGKLASVLKSTKSLADRSWQAEIALRRADYAIAIGDYEAVIAAVQETVGWAQASLDVRREAMGYRQWGWALWHQGNYEAAQSRFEQAVTLAHAVGMRQIESVSRRNLGVVFWSQGNYAQAKTYFEQSLQICHEIGDQSGESAALNNLGMIFTIQGDYAVAVAYQEQSLRLSRELGDRRSEGISVGNLGNMFTDLGDYDRAMDHIEQALCIAREVDDRGTQSYRLSNLGLIHHHLGNDETAREYGKEALLIARQVGQRRWQGYALTNLGHALTSLGQLTEAIESYQQALDIRQELGEKSLAVESLAGLARAFLAQGDLTQAQSHAERILDHLENDRLDGADEPFRIYLTCYHVLCANQDSAARDILNKAHCFLQEQAVKISDGEMRRSFLENVAAHREIVREFSRGEFAELY
ncbi:MAG: tetratricopeptide repeat protein [Chloroflexi bacterium]|nr:tetratricopeptide repeat protein [Chloroflexota bacterium]